MLLKRHTYITMKKSTLQLEGIQLLKTLISEVLTERKRKHKNTPGGGLTDMGALKRVSPGRFVSKVKAAVETSDGDMEKASQILNAAPRTIQWWMEDPSFNDLKIAREKDREEDKKEKAKKEKAKEKRENED